MSTVKMMTTATLALLLLPACKLSTSSSTIAPTSAPSPVERVSLTGFVASPTPFTADPKTWQLALTWDAAPADFGLDHYEVTRDTKTIAKDVSSPSFTDQVAPEEKYRYGVVGVATDGTTTKPALISVQTRPLPLADARMQGRFLVRLHVTSSDVGAHGSFTMLWELTPTCGTGPCDAAWKAKGRGGGGRLSESGATYSGTIHAPFFIRSCSGGTISETLVFHLRVTDAHAVGNAWRATKFEGSISETAPASGCITGHGSYAFTGNVQT
jgi:hypothetical protein